MKKKIIALLAGAMLTLCAAGNALANFDNGDLIRVVYNHAGTVEVATDLGSISSLMSGTAAHTDAFSLSQITGATSMSDLYVSYFAINSNTGWVGYDQATAPVTGNRKFTSLTNSAGVVTPYYQTLGSGNQVVADQTYTNAFSSRLIIGNIASLNGYIPAGVEANLGALGSGGSVVQALYAFNNQGNLTGVTTGVHVNNAHGQQLLITTNANGTTTVAPAATPIPPAFLLMGSGLLGMVGIRRKINKA